MKSKRLIELLQNLDPSGEINVTTGGYAITHVDRLEGYYDGPGIYLQDGRFVIDDQDDKIVIHTIDAEDFIWDEDGDYSKIDLKIRYGKEDRLKSFQKFSEDFKRFHKQSIEEHTFQVLKKIQEGYWICQHLSDRGKYWGIFYVKSGHDFKRENGRDIYKDCNENQQTLCQGDVMALKESGFFEEIESKDYIHWRLKLLAP